MPGVRTDLQVLAAIADAMDVHLGLPDAAAARRELTRWASAAGAAARCRRLASTAPAGRRLRPRARRVLATWHQLLDAGRLQDGEPYLAGTARAAVAQMSAATAAEAGVADGGKVTVGHRRAARSRVPRRDHRHAGPGGLAADQLGRAARCRAPSSAPAHGALRDAVRSAAMTGLR